MTKKQADENAKNLMRLEPAYELGLREGKKEIASLKKEIENDNKDLTDFINEIERLKAEYKKALKEQASDFAKVIMISEKQHKADIKQIFDDLEEFWLIQKKTPSDSPSSKGFLMLKSKWLKKVEK